MITTPATRLFLPGLLLPACLFALSCATTQVPPSGPELSPFLVDVDSALATLLEEEDLDGDGAITVSDTRAAAETARGHHGDGRFLVKGPGGRSLLVEGTPFLAQLLEDLTLARESSLRTTLLLPSVILESPVLRTSRRIRTRFWDALTRRIDRVGIGRVVGDDKVKSSRAWVWAPASDPHALELFRSLAREREDLALAVEVLPRAITTEFVSSLGERHGLLTLAVSKDGTGVPYVVPGGRFNEMYGWDSYFTSLGLLADGRVDLARGLAENLSYEIMHYGKILNANRTYYLTRSQPPFLTSLLLATVDHLPEGERRGWIRPCLEAAIIEIETVWKAPPRLTETGLSRYHGDGTGPCVEVEPGHYDGVFAREARRTGADADTFEKGYLEGSISSPALDAFFIHDRAVRESGHDTTSRFHVDGLDRCADFLTVDLNCLLYKAEIDIARLLEVHFEGRLVLSTGETHESTAWREAARRRRDLLRKLLFVPDRGLFLDYDLARHVNHCAFSPTMLYPLFACHPDDATTFLLSREEARVLVSRVLEELEMPGGLAAGTADARAEGPARQWDWPHGWPPHQMMAWMGLSRFDLHADAERLAYRWLFTIARNAADYQGIVTEKLDVVARSHRVFAEYGNVGATISTLPREGFAWTNASFQVGLGYLSEARRRDLEALVPPERLFPDH